MYKKIPINTNGGDKKIKVARLSLVHFILNGVTPQKSVPKFGALSAHYVKLDAFHSQNQWLEQAKDGDKRPSDQAS